MFKAIIFDMDGLLVDSERIWFEAEKQVIESRGFEYTQEVREQIIGLRLDEFMTKLHKIYGFTETVEALMLELEDMMVELILKDVTTQPGAHEIVQWVAEQGIPHCIASSSSKRIIDATMQSQGWDDVFTLRYTADSVPNGKPAPDVYLLAAQGINIAPEDCLALEDSPNGSRAAVAAGMTCYAVPDKSHSTPAAFKDITPHVFDSLHDVLAHLKTL
ncbi:MAG: HAD-IA family hydrolase [Anaerolineae bacterium]